jgi:hypothetical protein
MVQTHSNEIAATTLSVVLVEPRIVGCVCVWDVVPDRGGDLASPYD